MSFLLSKISYHIVENIIVMLNSDYILARVQTIVPKFNDLKIIDRINIKRTRVISNVTRLQIPPSKNVKMDYYIRGGSTDDRPSEIRKYDNSHIWKAKDKKRMYYRKDDLPDVINNEKCIRSWSDALDNYHRTHDMPAKYSYYVSTCEIVWIKNGYYYRDHKLPSLIFSNGSRYWYGTCNNMKKRINILEEEYF